MTAFVDLAADRADVRLEGSVQLDELLAAVEDIFGAGDPARVHRVCCTFARGVDLCSLRSGGLRLCVERVAGVPGRSGELRLAVVAVDDHGFGLARMYEVYAETLGLDVSVFRDAAAAEDWLDEVRGGG